MKIQNNVFAIATAALIITSANSITAFADGEVSMGHISEEYKDFIEFSLPRHIYANELETGATVKYSEPIPYYDFLENELLGTEVLVVDDDTVIGKLRIYGEGDNIASDFDTAVNDEMTTAYLNGDMVAIGRYDNEEWFFSDTLGYSFVCGDDNNSVEPENEPSFTQTITISDEVSSSYAMPRSIMTYRLDVPYVSNSFTYNSEGQCWASCVAMLVNYANSSMHLTSDKVHQDLIAAGINYSENGTAKALDYYGYDYSKKSGAMTSSDVALTLKENKPIIMYIKNSTTSETHAIVISGLVLDVSSSTYSLRDPNMPALQTHVQNTSLNTLNSSFSYTSTTTNHSYTFDKWYYSFY